jgi:hypothetical protein
MAKFRPICSHWKKVLTHDDVENGEKPEADVAEVDRQRWNLKKKIATFAMVERFL